ncbi:MAG: polysaccharide pyruvyl transferase family protein [Gammaproteobacteria bacterium]|nr:polysaccharide pyruvyl transferase family protein [Gammaproteobacteria bacterium]
MTKRICIIGNFSGRNAGDAAILGGLLKEVTAAFGPLRFDVPTINTGFVSRQYADFDVEPVGMMPWNLSIKIFGLPIIRSILRSDLVLVTDAILFDMKLLNPLFNYLSTMALVLPMAKWRGIPVVLYNCSLGPAKTNMGKACLQRVLEASDVIILRDEESLGEIPKNRDIESRIQRGADCALNIDPAEEERIDAILRKEDLSPNGKHFLTFNVNSYIDVFVRSRGKRIGIEEFAALISAAVNQVMPRLDANVVFVVTQPMDMKITNMVLSGIEQHDRIRMIKNPDYTFAELAGVFSRAQIHVGMRTHSLILASSVITPVVGIISTPKNRGYMKSIKQDERMVEFDVLTADYLADMVVATWDNRQVLREELAPIIVEEKAKAAGATEFLQQYLETSAES